ncbi:MAG: DnaB-like helicase C-terminal domain-containing protein [Micropepsaceae bacterium]
MTNFDLPRPHDTGSEQQLLGALLLDPAAAERIAAALEPTHFAEPLHQRIYDAIARATKAGLAATPNSLKPEFEDDAQMREVGGAAYLAELAGYGAQCLDTRAWAEAVKNLAFRRRLIAAGRDMQNDALNAGIETEPHTLAERAEELIAHALGEASETAADRFQPVGQLAHTVLSAAEEAPTLKFGLARLDEITGGLRPKELVIVGARPGMGKTAFAGHVALSAAKQGSAVAFFSMEMAAAAITLRLITAEAFADGRSTAYAELRRGRIPADEGHALFEAEARLRALPLYIHEGRQLTPSGLLLAARRAQKKLRDTSTPLGLVIVDHIQKIRPDRDCRGNKVAEMTEISDAMQKMAGALNVPVIALSQLNRAVESREGKRPELADLRESGAIEQDADLVLLLFREAYYKLKAEPQRGHPDWPEWYGEYANVRHDLDIHIAKHRNGREGQVRAHFDAPSSGIR